MLWIYGVCALCLLVCLPFYMYYKKSLRLHLAVAFKMMGTLCAAGMALTSALRLDPRCWVCFAALMLHATADVILEFNMYIGAGCFLAGHICYIAFFTQLCPPAAVHLICVIGLLAVMVYFFFWRWRREIGKQLPFFAVYGGILSVMSACALACLTGHNLQGWLIAAGGALFFLSDSLLCARLLFPTSRGVDWTILITYYTAQLLFGISCLLI